MKHKEQQVNSLRLHFYCNWKIISERKSRLLHGRNALLILTLLLQYRKYESENPYVVKLSILDDELALTVNILIFELYKKKKTKTFLKCVSKGYGSCHVSCYGRSQSCVFKSSKARRRWNMVEQLRNTHR